VPSTLVVGATQRTVTDEVVAAGQEAQTDLIILTHDTREGTMNDALARMQALSSVLQPITRIRKEELA
jgi:homoserine dehydrogenase